MSSTAATCCRPAFLHRQLPDQLIRSEKYGSPRTNVKELRVARVHLSEDRLTVHLTLPEIAPVQQMEIRYTIKGADGSVVKGSLQNTIHALGEAPR